MKVDISFFKSGKSLSEGSRVTGSTALSESPTSDRLEKLTRSNTAYTGMMPGYLYLCRLLPTCNHARLLVNCIGWREQINSHPNLLVATQVMAHPQTLHCLNHFHFHCYVSLHHLYITYGTEGWGRNALFIFLNFLDKNTRCSKRSRHTLCVQPIFSGYLLGCTFTLL